MSNYGDKVVDALSLSAHRVVTEEKSYSHKFLLVLFAVFVAVDLLALVAGARSYGSLVYLQGENDKRIMVVGPILSAVRANDTIDSLTTGQGPEGKALVLVQHDLEGSYETRIYQYQGKVVQEYSLSNMPYNPQKATELADSSSFDFAYADGLLSVTTDAGEVKVALRCAQGGV